MVCISSHLYLQNIVLYDGLFLCLTVLQSLNLHSIVNDTVKSPTMKQGNLIATPPPMAPWLK